MAESKREVLVCILAAAVLAAAAPQAGPQTAATTADVVLKNGAILTFHGVERLDVSGGAGRGRGAARPRFARAVAIAGGRIVFVGDDAKAKRYVGPATRVIDLAGRMVMPGIVDAHFHGTRPTDCDMGYAGGTVPQVVARLQACLDSPAQARFKGTNVRFSADHFFGDALEPAGAAMTRFDLDRLATTRPVTVTNFDGHKFWMNSKAIANAGLSANTPDSPEGEIGRQPDGTPNGFFADLDVGDWGTAVPVTEADRLHWVRQTIADANRAGITTVFIPGGGEDEIAQWGKVRDEGKMTLRADIGLSAQFVRGNGDAADLSRRIAALEAYRKHAGGPIAVTSVKVYCDGVLEYPAQTGAMLHPYAVNAGTRDKPEWRPGTFRGPDPSCADARAGFVALDRAGWRIHVHALGDRAARDALDNFQAALETNGAHDRRHTITHLEAIDAADVPRFASLGVVASMSLQWARLDAATVTGTAGYLSDALYARLFPTAELWRAGAVIAGGSDYPVDPLLPFVQIETAIDHSGEAIPGVFPGVLSPGETIPDPLAVVKMHTINAAWQLHMEDSLGSIETGKQADLIVLDQNLFEGPVERISETKVLMTMLGGKVVYDAGKMDHGNRRAR